jgi:hypothetical protein
MQINLVVDLILGIAHELKKKNKCDRSRTDVKCDDLTINEIFAKVCSACLKAVQEARSKVGPTCDHGVGCVLLIRVDTPFNPKV